MFEEGLTDSILLRLIGAFSVFLGFVVAALIVRIIISLIHRRLKNQDTSSVTSIILQSVKTPITAILLISGLLSAYLLVLSIENVLPSGFSDTRDLSIKIWKVMTILITTFAIAKTIDHLIDWYLLNIAEKTETKIDDTLLPTLRRVLPITIYAAGALVAIDSIGISISPILAGLGIGGLAVALAVQPTLSNFFAGTYVVTEGELKEGDFIELEGGPSGYVEEVGWRSTKIRSRFNNLVIIPNSRMAESIVTNYFSPTPAMNVIVTGGVAYESNLVDVEKYALEEARTVIEESEKAIKGTEPSFGFSNFGDSNVDFYVFLQAIDRAGTFGLRSELIKRIHDRFNREGIEINYPVRKLILPEPANDIGEIMFDPDNDN
ncbi:MAG: membrane protein [Chloroflexota bacterium]|nr:MAG: membrane protein [Chloroflexota bacterium]